MEIIKFNPEAFKSTSPLRLDTAQASSNINLGEIYDYAGSKLGYISRYPTYNPNRDNEDFFAQKQSGLDKSLNALQSFGVLAGNTFLNHFASYGRQVAAATNGDWSKLWDDEFGENTAQSIRAQFNLNPIYETASQQQQRDSATGLGGALKQFVPFTGRAGNAWANLASQLGFTAGTMAAVGAETLALGFLAPETGGASVAVAAAKSGANANKIKNALYTVLKTPKALFNIKNANNLSTVGKVLNSAPLQTYRMFVAASGEAAIEANMAALEFKENQIDRYIKENGKEPPSEWIAELEKESVKMGNTVFNWNIPVLMVSNAVTIGNLFRPANPTLSKQIIKEIAKKAGLQSSKTAMSGVFKGSKVFQKIATSPITKAGKVITFATKENLMEGVEEVAQGIGSRAAQHYFDMFKSDEGKGVGGFMAAMGEEFKTTFKANGEGWDEFVSGLLTGYGIKAVTSVADKVSGTSAKRQEFIDAKAAQIKASIEMITDPKSNKFRELVVNTMVADNMQNAINNNDSKAANDYKLDAMGELMMNLEGTGLGEQVYDHMGEIMKDFKEKDALGFAEMMGESSVETVITKLKDKQKKFDSDVNQLKKNIGNPYSLKNEPRLHHSWNKAIQIAAMLNTNAQDAFNRYTGIQQKLINEDGVAELLVESMLDPSKLNENKLKLSQLIADQKESLSIEGLSATEKQLRQSQIDENEKQLAILSKIEGLSKKELNETSANDKAAILLAGLFGDDKLAPQGLRQDLIDMQLLESENKDFLIAYNLLSNPEYFNKMGQSFVRAYQQGTEQLIKEGVDNLNKDIIENQPVVSTSITEEEYETLINDIENISDLRGLPKNVTVKNGKLIYKGKTHDTVNDLINDLESNFSQQLDVQVGDKTMREILKERLNGLLQESNVEQTEETVRQNVVSQPRGNNFTKVSPKTKATSESKVFGWMNISLKDTLLHYFDSILGKHWQGEGLASILAKLEANGQEDDAMMLEELADELGGDVNLTMLYLADSTTLSKYAENDDIRIHHDGIRYYILTNANKSAVDVIKNATGLTIEMSPNVTVVLDENGNPISSPFRQNLFDATTDAEIHSMKIGDAVELIIADTEYNRQLTLDYENKKISKTQYYDRLVVHAISNDKVVGVLRAGDFLFEKNNAKAELKKFRNKFKNKKLGDSIGIHNVTATSTTRNFRIDNGKIVYTPVNEWSAGSYTKQYYYVRETIEGNLEVVDQDGNIIDDSDIDLRKLEPNTVLMKIQDDNGRNHTVTLFREDTEERTVTETEFFEKFEEVSKALSTNLSLSEPIASKRLIIDLTNESESLDNKVDEVLVNIQDFATETPVEESPIPLPESTRDKLEVISEQDRIAIETKYGVSISVNPATGKLKIDILSNTLTDAQINELQKDILNAKGRAVFAEEALDAEVIQSPAVVTTLDNAPEYRFTIEDGKKVISDRAGNKLILQEDGSVVMEGDFDINALIEAYPDVFNLKNTSIVQVRDMNNNPKALPVSEAEALAESINSVESVNEASRTFDIFGHVKEALDLVLNNNGSLVIGLLSDLLQKERLAGNTVNSLQELLELAVAKGVLNQDAVDAFNFAVTPIFRADFWLALQSSESVWDSNANTEWQIFTRGLSEVLTQYDAANFENTPPSERKEFLNELSGQLRRSSNEFKLDVPELAFYSLSALRKVMNTLKEVASSTDVKKSFLDLANKLKESGLTLYTNSQVKVLRVSRESLLRKPLSNPKGDIFTDLEMSNVDGATYVRNEADGFFVKVNPINKKASENIRNLQNHFVSLLNIKPTIQYLQAYERINGSFDTLKQRLTDELTKVYEANDYGVTPITDAQVLRKGTNFITSRLNYEALELKNDTYTQIKNMNGEFLYIKNGESLSAVQIDKLFTKAGFKKTVLKNQSKIGKRLERLNMIDRKIEELTCR